MVASSLPSGLRYERLGVSVALYTARATAKIALAMRKSGQLRRSDAFMRRNTPFVQVIISGLWVTSRVWFWDLVIGIWAEGRYMLVLLSI